jgi:hypothetical protein
LGGRLRQQQHRHQHSDLAPERQDLEVTSPKTLKPNL